MIILESTNSIDVSVYGIALLPIIVGIVQIIKGFNVPPKYLPIIAILVSEAISIFFLKDDSMKKAILVGLQMGLASVGLYSGFKNTSNSNVKKNK